MRIKKHVTEKGRPARENVVLFSKHCRLVQEPVLEGRDGVDLGWTPALGEDHVCQRYRCECVKNI